MTIYNKDWPQDGYTLEECIRNWILDGIPIDESELSLEDRMMLEMMCQAVPSLSRNMLAKAVVVESVYGQETLERSVAIISEQRETPALTQVSSTRMPIAENFAKIDCCENLDTQKLEKLTGDNNEVNLDIDDLDTLIDHDDKLSVHEESSVLLEEINLGDEIEVDTILNEIDTPKVENDYRKEDIMFNKVDEDEVDNFIMNSFEHEVDFIIPSHSFDPHVQLNNKEEVKFYATFVVNFLDFSFSILLWKTVCFFVHFVSYLNRRRIKGALAQPFDTYD